MAQWPQDAPTTIMVKEEGNNPEMVQLFFSANSHCQTWLSSPLHLHFFTLKQYKIISFYSKVLNYSAQNNLERKFILHQN